MIQYTSHKNFVEAAKNIRTEFPLASITYSSTAFGDTLTNIAVLHHVKRISGAKIIHFVWSKHKENLDIFSWLPDILYFYENPVLDELDYSFFTNDNLVDMHFIGVHNLSIINQLTENGKLSFFEVMMLLLKVPLNIEMPNIIKDANYDGMEDFSNKIFIIPHSKTVRNPSDQQFQNLINKLFILGYEILFDASSGHNFVNSNPITGSISEIIQLAKCITKGGGRVISVRSGLSDTLWFAKIPQIFLYPASMPVFKSQVNYIHPYEAIQLTKGFEYPGAHEEIVFWKDYDDSLISVENPGSS
jgi:hypothetical protein